MANEATTNKLFGWKSGVRFRDPDEIDHEMRDLEDRLEVLRVEHREASAWHMQRNVYDGIINHLEGKPLTEDQEGALQWGWIRNE